MAVYAPSPKPPYIESAHWPKPTPHTGLPKAFTTVLAVILDYGCIALGFLLGFFMLPDISRCCMAGFNTSSYRAYRAILVDLRLSCTSATAL